jgi:hypothetical protein
MFARRLRGETAIHEFSGEANGTHRLFTWTADPDKIIGAIRPRYRALHSIHQPALSRSPVPVELWKTVLRKIVLLAFLAALWLEAHPAMASGDIGCSTKWTLIQRELVDCYDLPFLNPGNDSRVNLLLLLLIDAGRAIVQIPAPSELQVQPPFDSTAPFISLGELFAAIGARAVG